MKATFAQPHYLYLLLLVPVLAAVYLKHLRYRHPYLSFPSLPASGWGSNAFTLGRGFLFGIRLMAFALLVVALANPQATRKVKRTAPVEGIDMILVADVSQSMLAEDFTPNRKEALKALSAQFVAQRQNDRLGLVVYAGESFTACPMTTNHRLLIERIQKMDQVPLTDGTAIGLGLATAVRQMRADKTKSRVIVLMTDGENNAGYVAPLKAAGYATHHRIKVYTIGIGTKGMAPYPVRDFMGRWTRKKVPVGIDENVLKAIARETGGKYYRATDNNALAQIYSQIDKLEKRAIKHKYVLESESAFRPFALAAMGLLLVEYLLRFTLFRTPL